jgi:uncharacterized protein YeaO (DUF488 family)
MIRIVRLGTPRTSGEGLRLGTVRKPPRGVPKSEYAKRDFYDVWFPTLAPSLPLMQWIRADAGDPKRWKTFAQRYRKEMSAPDQRHALTLLAAMSQSVDFSVGCYCEDESRCHRSLLRDLLRAAGAKVA